LTTVTGGKTTPAVPHVEGPVVRDGHAMGSAADRVEDVLRACTGWRGVDYPLCGIALRATQGEAPGTAQGCGSLSDGYGAGGACRASASQHVPRKTVLKARTGQRKRESASIPRAPYGGERASGEDAVPEVVIRRIRCLGFLARVHRRESSSTLRICGRCARPVRGGRLRNSGSHPRGVVEKNRSPQATGFQELQAQWRSTSTWCRERRMCAGRSWSGERGEHVAKPATAAPEAAWGFGASRSRGIWESIWARNGVRVAPLHGRVRRTEVPILGTRMEPL
jgi:hypothetical protein